MSATTQKVARCRHTFDWSRPDLAGYMTREALLEVSKESQNLVPCWLSRKRKYDQYRQDARKRGLPQKTLEDFTFDWADRKSCLRCPEAVKV